MAHVFLGQNQGFPRHDGDPVLAAYDSAIAGWARTLDMRAQYSEGFSARCSELSARLAAALGLPEEEIAHLRRGALLHDIGMMSVPDTIIRKPGPLTQAEWVVVRLHPSYADDLLGPVASLRPALPIPRYHHERWDGSGYPHGLRGEQIPLPARIFAVANAWIAMTSDRPFRRALPPEEAQSEIGAGSGSLFDPEVADAFRDLLDQRARP